MSHVTCHVSCVMCQVSGVACQVQHDILFVGELVGGGSVINGAHAGAMLQ